MKRGFTIAELTIVLTVLAILMSLAVLGSSAMLERSRANDALSKVQIIASALEKYYNENGEYPSAASLAGGGNGRALTAAQYNAIASTLQVKPDVLSGGMYKFVPCAVSGSLCCTMNASNECALPASDGESRYIMYMTRTATEAASGAQLTFKVPVSGCIYYFKPSATADENGYSSYLLMFRNYNDPDWWTSWRVYTSQRDKTWRGSYCDVNNYKTKI